MATARQATLLTEDDAIPARPPRTLTKSVHALAIEPLNQALSVTGRKAYNVMLHIAQHTTPDPQGWHLSPVSAILRGFDTSTKSSMRLQRYIEQMVQTAVVYRPLAATEQGDVFGISAASQLSLECEDQDQQEQEQEQKQDHEAEPVFARRSRRPIASSQMTDEARTFTLLAEARIWRQGGEAWVAWYYPPSIREQLISPDRWAQIDLNTIAQLTTYAGLALYEMCARFKGSPAGLTSRQSPDFWMRVLREGGGVKPREWRKIKNELVMPAIAEINEVSEIKVEMIEHRLGNAVESVQFAVKQKSKESRRPNGPIDISSVVTAAKHGIKEAEYDTLVAKYGEFKVSECLAAMQAHLTNPASQKIMNKLAYLKAVLVNKYPDNQAELLSPAEQAIGAAEDRTTKSSTRDELTKQWLTSRFKQLNRDFGALSEGERARWIDETATRFTTPAVRKRLDNRDWVSPLVNQLVLDVYASGVYGPDWKTPGEIDLAVFSAAQNQPAA